MFVIFGQCQVFLLAMNEGNISTASASDDRLVSNMRHHEILLNYENMYFPNQKWYKLDKNIFHSNVNY